MLDDYAHLLYDVIEHCPSLLFLSPVFPAALQSTLSTLTLMSPQIVLTALDVIRSVIGHESLQHDPATDRDSSPFVPQYPLYAAAIRAAMDTVSFQLVGILLDVLVGGYEDTSSNVLTVFRLLSMQFPAQLAAAIPAALESMPIKVASQAEKEEFLLKFNTYVSSLLAPSALADFGSNAGLPPRRTRTTSRSRSLGSCERRSGARRVRTRSMSDGSSASKCRSLSLFSLPLG